MHRDGSIWLGAADCRGCLLGVEMALIKRGSPASNRHQGDVDIVTPSRARLGTCVPRKPTAARALDNVAERGPAMRTPRVSPAVVVGGQDAYLYAAKLHKVTRRDLPELHAAADDRPEQPARTRWGDKNGGFRNESERGQVGVVGVQVGDEDKVRMRSLRGRNRTPHSTEMAQASGQDWVE